MFTNFSEWDAVVVATSNCYNNKTSEPTEFCALCCDINISKWQSLKVTHFGKWGHKLHVQDSPSLAAPSPPDSGDRRHLCSLQSCSSPDPLSGLEPVHNRTISAVSRHIIILEHPSTWSCKLYLHMMNIARDSLLGVKHQITYFTGTMLNLQKERQNEVYYMYFML